MIRNKVDSVDYGGVAEPSLLDKLYFFLDCKCGYLLGSDVI